MARLILNLDEEVILWIVSSAAREHTPVSEWVGKRLVCGGTREDGATARKAPSENGTAWDDPGPDPFPEELYDPV